METCLSKSKVTDSSFATLVFPLGLTNFTQIKNNTGIINEARGIYFQVVLFYF